MKIHDPNEISETVEPNEMTICIDCKHHDYMPGLYSRFCTAPAVEYVDATDPVTGETYATGKENKEIKSAYKYPLCQHINKDGNCPHFEKKD
tara:strand:- start:409 stop:684 length:276 start_codon:yes stop_codon:yes gene_type:complete